MLVEQSEMQARNDGEKKDHISKSQSQINDLQEKLMKQSELNQNLMDVKRDLESNCKDQQIKLSQQQHELDLIRNEIKDLRETNKGLDTTKFS
jgi:hypothetical protein